MQHYSVCRVCMSISMHVLRMYCTEQVGVFVLAWQLLASEHPRKAAQVDTERHSEAQRDTERHREAQGETERDRESTLAAIKPPAAASSADQAVAVSPSRSLHSVARSKHREAQSDTERHRESKPVGSASSGASGRSDWRLQQPLYSLSVALSLCLCLPLCLSVSLSLPLSLPPSLSSRRHA